MKKIVLSLMVIVLTVGLVGAGALAYFSDTETSSGNTFTAGTLDLTLDGGSEGITLTIGPVKPGPGFTRWTWILLKNVGSIPGELDIKISAITNAENYDPDTDEAEAYDADTNPTGDDNTSDATGGGELGDNFLIGFHIGGYHLMPPKGGGGANINWYDGYEWDGGTNASIKTALFHSSGGTELLEPGQTIYFKSWGWVYPWAGNSIQGDSFTFDVTFTLEQPEKD